MAQRLLDSAFTIGHLYPRDPAVKYRYHLTILLYRLQVIRRWP